MSGGKPDAKAKTTEKTKTPNGPLLWIDLEMVCVVRVHISSKI